MDERTLEQSLPQETFRRRIVRRKAFDKFDERANTRPLPKPVLHRLDNDAGRETAHKPLINDPGLQSMAKYLSLKPFNPCSRGLSVPAVFVA